MILLIDNCSQFLGLSFVPAIASGFVMPSQIIAQIGMSLDGLEDIAWIPGGWSIGAAVSFAIAGALSDIFGRRWVVMFGQLLVLVGSVRLRHRFNCDSTTDCLPDRLCYSRNCSYRGCR
jgi:MFS family permease